MAIIAGNLARTRIYGQKLTDKLPGTYREANKSSLQGGGQEETALTY